jgi:hypothetical protein
MAPMVPAQGCVSGPPLNRWLARAHCKNQLSVHGQLAGISKLNPRRRGASLSRSFFPDCIVGCAKPGSHAVRSPEKACDVLEASRGSICTNDGAWRRVARSRERPCLAVQAYCKNRPSDHGQLAGIIKLNPRRRGDSLFYKRQMRRGLASAQHAVPTPASAALRAREGLKTPSP